MWNWSDKECVTCETNQQVAPDLRCDKSDKDKKPDDKTKEPDDAPKEVICSYFVTWTRIYLILIVWAKYVFDVYISYVRQFNLLNKTTRIPNDLKKFYSDSDFEEVKVQCMFKTLLNLERKYNEALRLTVIYITNMYCTMWWISSKIASGFLSRIVTFQAMTTLLHYNLGDMLHHVLLILTSCSANEGACRFCYWIKDMILKCWGSLATLGFLEEVILAIILTLMTTPACIVLFLLYRIYKNFLLPHIIEENTSSYFHLQEGKLYNLVKEVCRKVNFPVETIYISLAFNQLLHGAKIRGLGDRRYIVLGWRLVDGHMDDVSTIRKLYSDYNINERKMYTTDEISAAIVRAKIDYIIAVPSQDLTLEAVKWVPTVLFAIFLTFGFFGGSRLGFKPAPPQTIAFTMSKHVAIPIFTLVQIIKNYECRKRARNLDRIVCEEGFGEELISYIGKEAKYTYRCPVEDPLYTWVYSTNHPPIARIQYLKRKLAIVDTDDKTVPDATTNGDVINEIDIET